MTFETLTQDGVTLDTITDESTGTRLTVSRLGAEPVSYARRRPDGSWLGFLHRDGQLSAPAAGWANHATVMGYYIHRLKGGRTVYRGKELKDGNHGFMRRKQLAAPKMEGNALSYRMDHSQYTPAEYPLDVVLTLTYALEASGGWRTTFSFENREKELTAHLGFGLHPGFAIGSLEACHIELPPGEYHRHVAPGDFLSGEIQAISHPGGEAPFPKETLPGSYLVELPTKGPKWAALHDPAGGRRVTVELDECPYLTIWSDGRGDFVCLEPCWGLPDHHEQRAFEDKLGIQTLAPGGTLTRGFVIRGEFE